MADEKLNVDLTHVDGDAVLVVRGEIDLSSARVLREAVERCQSSGVPVVLDFAGVTFMDSSGLTVLIDASTRHGDPVCVRNASERVRQLLEITGLESLICAEP